MPSVKSHPKSHSRVIRRSSACRPQVIRTRLESPKYFQLNTRATAWLQNEGKGKILLNTELSVTELMFDSRKSGSCTEMIEKFGEILPKPEILAQTTIINLSEQYIVGPTNDLKKHVEIPPAVAMNRQTDEIYESYTWFQNLVNCISKWSKALKQGAENSVGIESCHTAQGNSKESDSLGFSFFL